MGRLKCLVGFAGLYGVVAIAAFAPLGTAQSQLWIRQKGSAGQDTAIACAPDGAGGYYVTGYTTGDFGATGKGGNDVWLAHLDREGNTRWVHQFGSESQDDGLDVAEDGRGGVYVCGLTQGSLATRNKGLGDAWICHFNFEGRRTWIEQIGTQGNEGAFAVAPDGAGGVYVSGLTHGRIGGTHAGGGDVWLARYDEQGTRLWDRQFGTIVVDTSFALTPDGTGGVFITGETGDSLEGHNAGHMDAWVASYNGQGKRRWLRQLGTKQGDFIRAVAPDGEGGLYLGGRTFGSLATTNAGGSDVWIARYDARGNQSWVRQFGTQADEAACGMAFDPTGGVFVVGWSKGNIGGSEVYYNQDQDYWIARYDLTGNQSWIQQHGTPQKDVARDVITDGASGFIVTGFTTGLLGRKSHGSRDAWIARFDGKLATTAFCDTLGLNSIQCQGNLFASGSNSVGGNELEMQAGLLPPGSLGFIMHSSTYGTPDVPAAGESPMCLGSRQSRTAQWASLQQTNEAGRFSMPLDLTPVVDDVNYMPIRPGETWSFRAWYRDSRGTDAKASNLTTIVAIQFH